MTVEDKLARHLEADCQLAVELVRHADRCERERKRALAAVKALNLPASHNLRRKLLLPRERA